jgi:hypothetical protein
VPKEKPKVNGSSKEEAMLLDSDEDDAPADCVPSMADFNAEQEASDESQPYDKIIQFIDVRCGTGVRHVAIPHVPTHIRDSAPGAYPPILLSNIVVAATCNDNSIRLVTLPLLPPLPSVDGQSYKALQMVTIAGMNTHHDVPSSISITHSALSGSPESRQDSSKSRSRSSNPVNEDEDAATASHQQGTSWCFLLVSMSPAAGGLLLTHQIPVLSDTLLSASPDDLSPLQRCYLGFPCLSSNTVFNPSAFPADRHDMALVSATDAGCVKIYQVFSENRSNMSRGRRNSAATVESASSSLRTSSRGPASCGRFLITLYPGFVRSPSSTSFQRRKRTLDVAWAASGRAIIALLEDGEWGVWDLEGAGPGSGAANLLRGQSNMSGIQGGALTKFAFSCQITAAAEALLKTQVTEIQESTDEKLVPMTPHTRRIRSEGLFKGGRPSRGLEGDCAQPTNGHICITEHAPPTTSTLPSAEESLVIAHGSQIIFVPSLQALWRAETSSTGTFDSLAAIRPSQFPGLGLGGERLIGVAELPRSPPTKSNPDFDPRIGDWPDILVTIDRRMILFIAARSESVSTVGPEAQFSLRLGKTQEPAPIKLRDQALLHQGELDLEGMDRVLDGMRSENENSNGQGMSFRRGVAVGLENDGDVSMSSPTPKSGSRSRHTSLMSTGRNRAAAFS